MKKILLAMAVLLLIVTGCASNSTGIEGLVSAKHTEIKERIENKETFVFMISATSCSACKTYKQEVLTDYLPENKLTMLNVDVEKLGQPAMDYFAELLGDNFMGTPTTVVVKAGKITNVEVGVLPAEVLDILLVDFI